VRVYKAGEELRRAAAALSGPSLAPNPSLTVPLPPQQARLQRSASSNNCILLGFCTCSDLARHCNRQAMSIKPATPPRQAVSMTDETHGISLTLRNLQTRNQQTLNWFITKV